MITVIQEAKVFFLNVEHPEGTVLRLNPMMDQNTGEAQIGISVGEPRSYDQVVEHDGGNLLHIEASVSKMLSISNLT